MKSLGKSLNEYLTSNLYDATSTNRNENFTCICWTFKREPFCHSL